MTGRAQLRGQRLGCGAIRGRTDPHAIQFASTAQHSPSTNAANPLRLELVHQPLRRCRDWRSAELHRPGPWLTETAGAGFPAATTVGAACAAASRAACTAAGGGRAVATRGAGCALRGWRCGRERGCGGDSVDSPCSPAPRPLAGAVPLRRCARRSIRRAPSASGARRIHPARRVYERSGGASLGLARRLRRLPCSGRSESSGTTSTSSATRMTAPVSLSFA